MRRDSELSTASETWITVSVVTFLTIILALGAFLKFNGGFSPLWVPPVILAGALIGLFLSQFSAIRKSVSCAVCEVVFWWA